jgi:hypothetical protein
MNSEHPYAEGAKGKPREILIFLLASFLRLLRNFCAFCVRVSVFGT